MRQNPLPNVASSVATKSRGVLRPAAFVVVWTTGAIVVDQVSKFLVTRIWPDLIVLNKNVAFSIELPVWVVLLALIVLVAVGFSQWRGWSAQDKKVRAWALGLLLGGALSNILDRVMFGAVRDFIDLRVWPVFNLADVALTLGVIGVLWYAVRSSHTSHGTRQGVTSKRT